MDTQEEKELTNSDWENRILCRNESCIGVIGEDGRCMECGLPYEAEQIQDRATSNDRQSDPETLENPETDSDVVPEDAPKDVPADMPADMPDDDWDNRILCRDGNCIGVIGPDGRCKECGTPYDEEQPGTPGPTPSLGALETVDT
jgi:hypothetical protein